MGRFNTFLDGIQSTYSSLYLRHLFDVAPGELPSNCSCATGSTMA